MHTCTLQGALYCSHCTAYWCYGCAYKTYFGKIITIDNVTIIRSDRCIRCIVCASCQRTFDLQGIDKLQSVRFWGSTLGTDTLGADWATRTDKLNIETRQTAPRPKDPPTLVKHLDWWRADSAHCWQSSHAPTANNLCVTHVCLNSTSVTKHVKTISHRSASFATQHSARKISGYWEY